MMNHYCGIVVIFTPNEKKIQLMETPTPLAPRCPVTPTHHREQISLTEAVLVLDVGHLLSARFYVIMINIQGFVFWTHFFYC